MLRSSRQFLSVSALVLFAAWGCSQPPASPAPAPPAAAAPADPLPSWNDTETRKAIIAFVGRVTSPGPDMVAPAERIAVFDNDGTLWTEQPLYFQLAFALDEVKAMADKHPDWKTRQPFKGVLENDMKAVLAGGEKSMMQIVGVTHTGMSTEEFRAAVDQWLKTAVHPRFKRPYTDLVFQPMLEVLTYLRANGFKTFIVSGGEVEFMRAWAERVYGIPPEQVVGTRFKTTYVVKDGVPALMRMPALDFNDDKDGKPVGIATVIGRRPTIAFGNSDGDFQMLEYTTKGAGPRLGLIVHHTDADREWAYDRKSAIGTLIRGLDEASARGWVLIDMKRDWKKIYPFEH